MKKPSRHTTPVSPHQSRLASLPVVMVIPGLFKSENFIVPIKAALLTAIYCLIGGLVFSYGQGLTAIESIYFMVVTMSTVGYGDFSPEGPWLRVFCVIWIFVAIFIVFPALTGAVVLFTGAWTKRGRKCLERIFPPTLVDVDGDGETDFKLPERHAAWFFAKNLLPATFMWLVIQLASALGFVGLEGRWIDVNGWDFGSAFYHCVVTATTVGYGDMSIATDGGKMWACGHILSTLLRTRTQFIVQAPRFTARVPCLCLVCRSLRRNARRARVDLRYPAQRVGREEG